MPPPVAPDAALMVLKALRENSMPGMQDRLFCVANLLGSQQRLIGLDQRDDVLAGNVPMIDDGDNRPVEGGVELDAANAAACNTRANRAAVKKPRNPLWRSWRPRPQPQPIHVFQELTNLNS